MTTREDFGLSVGEFRRRMNGRLVDKLAAFALPAALGLALVLMKIGESRGWPAYMQPVLIASAWAVGLIPLPFWRARQRRLLRELGLRCGGCGKPLVDTFRMRYRAESVLVKGTCPSCGKQIFAHGLE